MARTMPIPPDYRKKSKAATKKERENFRNSLLDWYDRHARVLPWRSSGAVRPDPYHVWLSEIMLQQTTVQAVMPYFVRFLEKWPSVHDLAAARDEDVMREWAGLGYYARARNLLKTARIVSSTHGGIFPDNIVALKTLSGIGDYTAAAITSIAFDNVATVIDGNVERVVSRWFALETPLPASKPEIRILAASLFEGESTQNTDISRAGDFAQAMMDLGATICTPTKPKCGLCPVSAGCQGRICGLAEKLPYRQPKTARPKRAGYVYWITRENGDVLFETRPKKGLLGGMTGLPTSEWVIWAGGRSPFPETGHISDIIPDIRAAIKEYMGEKSDNSVNNLKIRHIFTHFELELRGIVIKKASNEIALTENRFWVPQEEIEGLGLPTVFRKFTRLMR